MKIQTEKLKEAVSLLHTIAGRYNALVMTCLLTIRVKDNTLYLYSTDNANTLVAKFDIDEEVQDAEMSVGIEQIYKLMKTLTSEFVDLKLNAKSLTIKSNKSSYVLKATLDSTGNFAVIAEPTVFCDEEFKPLSISDKVYSSLSISMPTDDFIDIYKNTYFGDCVITANSMCASKSNTDVFENEILLNAKIFSVLHYFNEISLGNTQAILRSDDYTLYIAHNSYAIEDFHANDFKEMFDSAEYGANVEIAELKNALRRLSAFDPENVTLEFDEEVIRIKASDVAVEVINANCSEKMAYEIDFKLLKKYVTKTDEDIILYGFPNFIQLGIDEVSHLISATQLGDDDVD